MVTLTESHSLVCRVSVWEVMCWNSGQVKPKTCLNNNLTIYVFLTLATLPWTCDDFHRQRTFVLRILSLSLSLSFFHPFLFNFASFYFPVVLFTFSVAWLERLNAFFLSFSTPKNVEKV